MKRGKKTGNYLKGVAEEEAIQNVAEAIFEKIIDQEISGIDEIYKYTDSNRFMNPKQIF